jgi:hypothetical protein
MKITTGRQLLEWLQKQPTEYIDGKLLVVGDNIPVTNYIYPSALKQDVYKNGSVVSEESDMMEGYNSMNEMMNNCEKIYDKGGIIIYL